MAKKRKGKKGRGSAADVAYDSDDERAYEKEDVPDPTSSKFYNDAVDDFHSNRDKILLDTGAPLGPAESSDDEQEGILDIDDSDDSSEDENDREMQKYKKQMRQLKNQGFREKMGSDVEEDEDDGLPDEKAWGKKRKQFYGADVDDNFDYGSDEEAAAVLEEKEALAIQQRLAQQLDEGDFGLDIFTIPGPEKEESEEKTEQKIEKDLSTLSKKEKLKLLKKESPELLELIEDYKSKMTELSERLIPIHKQIKNGTLPAESSAAKYVTTKVQLSLNYCVNITFYMMLKAKKTPVHNHPVITRLLQYRNFLKQLETADEKITSLIDETLEKIKNGETLVPESVETKEKTAKAARKKRKLTEATDKNKKRLSEMLDESSSSEEDAASDAPEGRKRKKEAFLTDAEKEALQNYAMLKAARVGHKPSDDEEEEEEEMDAEEEDAHAQDGDAAWGEGDGEEDDEENNKRPINYQISKNKGLTPRKKKENRNPRVKHKRKYRKALIRRKGQVRTVRTEMQRYSGEMFGIRAGVVASRKLKG